MVEQLYQDMSRLLLFPLSKGNILAVSLIGPNKCSPLRGSVAQRLGLYKLFYTGEQGIYSLTYFLSLVSQCSLHLYNFSIGAPASTTCSTAQTTVNHLLNKLLAGHHLF
ncbi:hypothetical protein L195_g038745 [Trifolium pratense]|uniref:Uncharacterized protein n=1 Tax=Trifolium pratense TaxID=57577 RepID=A0A2K3LVZ3_TRIPR|nr:hypothetical protein L195_g038745 [Trifolium pratense]